MTQTTMLCIAGGILLLAVLMAYQYMVHRVEGKCQVRCLLQPKYDFWILFVMVAAFFLAAYIFLRGFLLDGEGFMRGLMNALVMIWLAILGYIDLREKIIPNAMIGVGLLGWLILILVDIFLGGTPWMKLLVFSGIGGAVCGGLLFVIAIITKSGLGMGDAKMFLVLGLLYGLTDAYGILLFSMIAMGLVSIVLLIAKKVTTKTAIPMAPFVTIGFILSILAGM